MRSVVRNGFAFALLWSGNISYAQSNDSNKNNSTAVSSSNSSGSSSSSSSSHVDTNLLTTSTSTASATETRLPATCRSGTVNYITHSLPQQCPTSAWSGLATALSATLIQNATASGESSSVGTWGNADAGNESSTAFPSESAHQHGSTTSSSLISPITSSASGSSTTMELSVSSSSSPSPSSTPEVTADSILSDSEAESETDSPLDNANFLSFEEWKKQNLEKAGQSPDGGQRASHDGGNHNRARPEVALDALGDEGEIELDFSGFGRRPNPEEHVKSGASGEIATSTGDSPSSSGRVARSKDAGRTCKERSNYASFDCAATILKTNPEAKSSSAVLIENKDSYMLNLCSASNKFIIIELCDDILIDTIVLANYEFFSSIFRTFRVSVSDRYPVKADRWKELGVFEARNSRSVQAFLVEHSLIWARYLRIEFLTHFGTEYYCPVSLIRVHGTTMMEDYRHQEYINRGDNLDDGDDELIPAVEVKPAIPDTPTPEPTTSVNAEKPPTEESVVSARSSTHAVTGEARTATAIPPNSDALPTTAGTASEKIETTTEPTSKFVNPTTEPSSDPASSTPTGYPLSSGGNTTAEHGTSYMTVDGTTTSPKIAIDNPSIIPGNSMPNFESNSSSSIADDATSKSTVTSGGTSASNVSESSTEATASADPMPQISSASKSSRDPKPDSHKPTTQASSSGTWASISGATDSNKSGKLNGTSSVPSSQQISQQQIQPKPSSSSTLAAAPANPTTQESFFKSIHKRLSMLESNATLSLQYIESQSLLLRTAFQAVEKRQLKKTETFLSSLNASVTTELERFKGEYERLWEGVVIEMETQRRQSEREVLLVSERLRVVAEELVWQKRLGVVQSTLILLCLGLVLFARSGTGVGLEVPLLQQLGRSRWGSQRFSPSYYGMSPPQSPSPISPSAEDLGLGSPQSDDPNGQDKWNARRRGHVAWRSSNDDSFGKEGDGNVSEGTEGRLDARHGSMSTGEGVGLGRTRSLDIRFQSPTPTTTSPAKGKDDMEDETYSDNPSRLETGSDYSKGTTTDGAYDNHHTRTTREVEGDEENGDEEVETRQEDGDRKELLILPKETQSSPSTPSGTRDPQGLFDQEKTISVWPGSDDVDDDVDDDDDEIDDDDVEIANGMT